MRRLTSLVLLSAMTVGAAADPKPAATPPRSIDQFGAKLHAQVGKKQGNLIFSPASIAIALAMTREGATGVTAKEMDETLGKTTGGDAKALLKALQSSPKVGKPGEAMPPELALANRLFGDGKTPFVKRFLDVTRDDYGAPIEAVDFGKSEAARTLINKWVEKQTRDKIKDLIAPGIVNERTRLVLVNAIYLKAQWVASFHEAATKPAKFTLADGSKKDVPTMHTEASAKLGSYAGARTLDLPYNAVAGGPRLSMLIVVPDKAKLAAIEATYAKEGLAGFLKATNTQSEVNVALPKFKFGSDFSLGDALQAMGMKRAFTEGVAEFDGMTTAQRLHISKVIHKAFIAVDEKGTEASAATAVIMGDDGATKARAFFVDRSFAFFIHDENGTVLFGGRVFDPSQS